MSHFNFDARHRVEYGNRQNEDKESRFTKGGKVEYTYDMGEEEHANRYYGVKEDW